MLAAANADDALVLFEKYPAIDVLLTDVVMPGVSGPELTRQLVQRRPGRRWSTCPATRRMPLSDRGVLVPGTAFLQKLFYGGITRADDRGGLSKREPKGARPDRRPVRPRRRAAHDGGQCTQQLHRPTRRLSLGWAVAVAAVTYRHGPQWRGDGDAPGAGRTADTRPVPPAPRGVRKCTDRRGRTLYHGAWQGSLRGRGR